MQYDKQPYKGLISLSIDTPDFSKGILPHDQYRCLECGIPLIKAQQRSQSDISVSNENLEYSNIFPIGSPNSLSPDMRSSSHAVESIPSCGSSSTNTPHSTSSGNNSRYSGSVAESPKESGRKEVTNGDVNKSSQSPQSTKNVIDNDLESKTETEEGKSDSSSKLQESESKSSSEPEGEKLNGRDGQKTRNDTGEEEVGKQQGVLINIIQARYGCPVELTLYLPTLCILSHYIL